MTNQDKAIEVIRTWQKRHKTELDNHTGWAAQNLAGDLKQAGLLAPELPERPDDGVWGEEGGILIDTAVNGGVVLLPPKLGVIFIDPQEARQLALALLAAANYSEEA